MQADSKNAEYLSSLVRDALVGAEASFNDGKSIHSLEMRFAAQVPGLTRICKKWMEYYAYYEDVVRRYIDPPKPERARVLVRRANGAF